MEKTQKDVLSDGSFPVRLRIFVNTARLKRPFSFRIYPNVQKHISVKLKKEEGIYSINRYHIITFPQQNPP